MSAEEFRIFWKTKGPLGGYRSGQFEKFLGFGGGRFAPWWRAALLGGFGGIAYNLAIAAFMDGLAE